MKRKKLSYQLQKIIVNIENSIQSLMTYQSLWVAEKKNEYSKNKFQYTAETENKNFKIRYHLKQYQEYIQCPGINKKMKTFCGEHF